MVNVYIIYLLYNKISRTYPGHLPGHYIYHNALLILNLRSRILNERNSLQKTQRNVNLK